MTTDSLKISLGHSKCGQDKWDKAKLNPFFAISAGSVSISTKTDQGFANKDTITFTKVVLMNKQKFK